MIVYCSEMIEVSALRVYEYASEVWLGLSGRTENGKTGTKENTVHSGLQMNQSYETYICLASSSTSENSSSLPYPTPTTPHYTTQNESTVQRQRSPRACNAMHRSSRGSSMSLVSPGGRQTSLRIWEDSASPSLLIHGRRLLSHTVQG